MRFSSSKLRASTKTGPQRKALLGILQLAPENSLVSLSGVGERFVPPPALTDVHFKSFVAQLCYPNILMLFQQF